MSPTARRTFLLSASSTVASLALGACARGAAPKAPQTTSASSEEGERGEEEVTPTEDLMREHGAIERILLVYDDCASRLRRAQGAWPIEALAEAATLVRTFVEDYHERLEEEHVFPAVVKAGADEAVVRVLLRQHQVGRQITDTVRRLAVPATIGDATASKQLADLLSSFTRMYRPHAAREDTVVFVDFARALPEATLHALGEQFEAREEQLFGEHGFERIVSRIDGVEKALGLEDLAQFTPA